MRAKLLLIALTIIVAGICAWPAIMLIKWAGKHTPGLRLNEPNSAALGLSGDYRSRAEQQLRAQGIRGHIISHEIIHTATDLILTDLDIAISSQDLSVNLTDLADRPSLFRAGRGQPHEYLGSILVMDLTLVEPGFPLSQEFMQSIRVDPPNAGNAVYDTTTYQSHERTRGQNRVVPRGAKISDSAPFLILRVDQVVQDTSSTAGWEWVVVIELDESWIPQCAYPLVVVYQQAGSEITTGFSPDILQP